ncbi:MAG: hypothetical protein ACI395_06150 [Candidatus Cryptobacteroides sp.]
MKKPILTLFLAAAAFPAAAQDFGKMFDDFVKEAREEHSRFKDEANKKFSEFLNESWTEFKVFAGKTYLEKPKPRTAPAVPVEEPGIPEAQPSPASPETVPEAVPEIPDTIEEPVPFREEALEKPQTVMPGMRDCSYDFYGQIVRIPYPEQIADYEMAGNSEKDVAGFWNALSESDYNSVIGRLEGYASEMGLEGWSLFLLVENLSKAVFGPDRKDEMEVFKTFLLNQMGLDARMGLADGRLLTTVCIKEQVYSRIYCEFDGRKYYFSPDVHNVKRYKSYSAKFSDNLSPVSVEISKPMHLGGNDAVSVVTKCSKVFSSDIPLPVNSSQCGFYLDYPQVDVNIYARAVYDSAFTSALVDAFRPFVSGMDELAQVNLLLKFMHYDFSYSTDGDQFGYEKPFFLEENFIYPSNDCEDRSILFSFLVRNLLGLDVVLLQYPNHIATAVCFSKEVPGDSFLFEGRRFTVCDPTYIGAKAGMTMSGYRDAEFLIVE